MFARVGLGWLPLHTQTQLQAAITRSPLDSPDLAQKPADSQEQS